MRITDGLILLTEIGALSPDRVITITPLGQKAMEMAFVLDPHCPTFHNWPAMDPKTAVTAYISVLKPRAEAYVDAYKCLTCNRMWNNSGHWKWPA